MSAEEFSFLVGKLLKILSSVISSAVAYVVICSICLTPVIGGNFMWDISDIECQLVGRWRNQSVRGLKFLVISLQSVLSAALILFLIGRFK